MTNATSLNVLQGVNCFTDAVNEIRGKIDAHQTAENYADTCKRKRIKFSGYNTIKIDAKEAWYIIISEMKNRFEEQKTLKTFTVLEQKKISLFNPLRGKQLRLCNDEFPPEI